MAATVEITDRAGDWARVIQSVYRDECRRLNNQYPFERSLNIDLGFVPQKLFNMILESPDVAASDLRSGVREHNLLPKWSSQERGILNVRFFNHPRPIPIKQLLSSQLGKFVSVEGVVRRVHTTRPAVRTAVFRCTCGRFTTITQTGKDLECPHETCVCGKKPQSQKLVTERCETLDYQTVILQESPDKVLGSEMPASVTVVLRDDLCNKVNAGNRIVVTGTLQSYQAKPSDTVLNVEFEASHVSVLDKDFVDIDVTEEEEAEIHRMANVKGSWDKIVASVAPSIFGNETIKEALTLQLFGGVSDMNDDGTWNRGDVHILLIGDPGIAKSKLMDVVFSLCPRGIITSGKGSSVAGLTAAAVSDGSGGWTLDAGAVVLADRGQLLIDEMDKMSTEDRSALHRAMEQQEVPINKAGINTVLKSRCSILAAANPVSGRFDDHIDLASQFNLPPTLLSRFDLIFICKDVVSSDDDLRIAEFILKGAGGKKGEYSTEMLRKYISYAKQTCNPELSKEAIDEIARYYVELRSKGGRGKPMPVTPRQLEGLRRLTQASARARLSNVADLADAMKAIRMMEHCLLHVAYDEDSGVFDIDRVCTAMSKAKRDLMIDLKASIIRIGAGDPVHINTILEEMESKGYPRDKVETVLEDGYNNGAFTAPRRDFYKVM